MSSRSIRPRARRSLAAFVALSFVALVGACSTGGDVASTTPSGGIVREPLGSARPATASGQELGLWHYTIPPGSKLVPHHHPGWQVARIVSGTLTYTILSGDVTVLRHGGGAPETHGAGETITLAAGDTVVENPSTDHYGANKGAEPVELYTSTLFEQGQPPAIPLPTPGAGASTPSVRDALSSAERTWLTSHAEIRVATFVDYPPFGSVDETGAPVGFTVDLWRLVADRIGISVVFAPVPFPDQVAGVASGRFDSAAGFLVLDERRATFAFSRPYHRVTTGIYVDTAHADRTTIAALAGLTVAVIKDDSSQLTAEGAGLATLVVASYEESLRAVADGRAQAVIMDPPVADHYIAKDGLAGKVVLAGTPVAAGEVALPVRKDQTVLLGILDKALASIGQAEIDALLAHWVGR